HLRVLRSFPTRRSSDLAEGQRVTLEVVDGHAWLLTRATCNILHSTLDPLSRPPSLTGPRDAGRAACGRAGPASAARWRRGSSPSDRKSTRLNSSHVKIS